MTVEKWYTRKTSYGESNVVHAIMKEESEEGQKIVLLCRPGGTRQMSTLHKIDNLPDKFPSTGKVGAYKVCPACQESLR